MPRIECLASSDDTVVLRVDLCCRGCLEVNFKLVEVDRPAGSRSAPWLFKHQQLWSRMSFRCWGCDYQAADLRRVLDASAEDFSLARQRDRLAPRPDPYPTLPQATTLTRMYGVFAPDLAA